MPSVPYSGVPSVTPSLDSGIPYNSGAGVSPDAFGAAAGAAQSRMGGAEEGLGRSIEGFGDVLSKHAIKMQDEANKSWANDAFVKATTDTGQLEAELRSLQGKAALDYYKDKYVPGVTKIADDAAGSAPNIEAKRFFQENFRRQLGYDIKNGAIYSATQLKHYNMTTAQAVTSTAVGRAAAATEDEMPSLLETARRSIDDQAAAGNWSPEETALKKQIAESGVWSARLNSLAKSDPEAALAQFNKIKKTLDGETQIKLDDSLNKQFIQGNSRVEANKIMSSEDIRGTTEEGFISKVYKRADDTAEKKYPDNPVYQEAYRDSLKTKIYTDYKALKRADDEYQLSLKNTVNSELLNTNQRTTSLDQLSPKAQDAYLRSTPGQQELYNRQMRKNATQDIPETNITRNKMLQVRGLMLSSPDEFMKINPAEITDLPNKDQNQITRWQQDRKAVLDRGAKINGFVGQPDIQAMLNDAQIFRSRTDSTANSHYERFVAGAEVMLDREMTEKKRPLTPKENTDIAARLLRETATGSTWYGGTASRPIYEVEALKRPVTVSSPDDVAKLEKGQYYIRAGEKTPRIKQ